MKHTLTYARLLFYSQGFSLLVWPVGVGVLVLLMASSFAELYSEPESRHAYQLAIEAAPVLTSLSGVGQALDQLGGMIVNDLAMLLLPGLAVGAIMLSVKSTRWEEETGRVELLTSRTAGRLAPLTGAVVVVNVSFILTAAVVVGVLCAFGVPLIGPEHATTGADTGGAYAYGLMLYSYMVLFAGVGFLTAEFAQASRTAQGIAMTMFALMYLTRVIVNSGEYGISAGDAIAASWLSPLGWFDAVDPFGQMRWIPLLLLFVTGLVLIVMAHLIRARRDLDAGVIPTRPGPSRAANWSTTPIGLSFRLSRSTFFGWSIAVATLAVVLGGQLSTWLEALTVSEIDLAAMGLSTDASSITHLTMIFCVAMATAVGINQVARWIGEENSGRVELLLATTVSRTTLWLSTVGIALLVTLVLTLLAGLVYGWSGLWSISDTPNDHLFSFTDVMVTGVAYAVPGLLLVALAVFWVGNGGKSTAPVWVCYIVSVFLALFGPTLDVPEWIIDYGLFNAIGTLPLEEVNDSSVVIQLVLMVIALTLGTVRLRERDLR